MSPLQPTICTLKQQQGSRKYAHGEFTEVLSDLQPLLHEATQQGDNIVLCVVGECLIHTGAIQRALSS